MKFVNTQIRSRARPANDSAADDDNRAPRDANRAMDGRKCVGTGQGSLETKTEEKDTINQTEVRRMDSVKEEETIIGFLAESTEQFMWFVDWIMQEEMTCILIYNKREYYYKKGFLSHSVSVRQCKQ